MKTPAESYFTIPGNIFPAILDALEEPLFLLDTEFRYVWFNRAADALYHSVSGKHLSLDFDFNELLTAEQQPLFKAHLVNVLGGQTAHFQWNYLKSVSKWVSVSLYPCRAGDGTITGICGSLRDITEQKRISREMKVLSMVAKETMNAVLILKPGGEAIWINEGFTRLTGYSAEDIVGKTSREMFDGPGSDAGTRERIVYSRQNGLPFKHEQLIYTKERTPVWVRVEGQPMKDENGELSMFFVIVTDISEQRRMEEERLQNQIAQQKEITRLMMQAQEAERNNLGRELHDNVNQLLAAIALQLSYCSDNYDIGRPAMEECRGYIKMAMDEIRRLSHRMVLPHFSDGGLKYELNWLIANYKHTQDIRLDATGWDGTDIPLAIKVTFFRIAQEQLHNVHKHAQANKVLIYIKNDAESAIMSIHDDGIGFDPCQERHGIGITNIINRAEAWNGSSRFISSPGNGCTLLVNIPLSDPVTTPSPFNPVK